MHALSAAARPTQPSLWARLQARRANARAIRTTVRELEALSDRALADIGISRCDIPRVARGA